MTEEAILELFSEVDEPRTTPEVAERLGISKPATWKRLSDLSDRGLLEKHPSRGFRGDAWSISDEGRAALEGELVADEV